MPQARSRIARVHSFSKPAFLLAVLSASCCCAAAPEAADFKNLWTATVDSLAPSHSVTPLAGLPGQGFVCLLDNADGSQRLYYISEGGPYLSPPYGDISTDSITSDTTGKNRIAFCARQLATDKIVVNFLGAETVLESGLSVSGLVISPDGAHCAFVAASDTQVQVYLDGKLVETLDGICNAPPVFSGDSRHLAYVSVDNGNAALHIDGQQRADFRIKKFVALSIANDGEHYAYVAVDSEPRLVVNGSTYGPYRNVGARGIVFSKSGKKWLCVVERQDGRMSVVVDGQEIGPYELVFDAIFDSNDRLLYSAGRAGEARVFQDDAMGTDTYDDILAFGLSQSGKVAYKAQRGDKFTVTVDNEKLPEEDGIRGFMFDESGDRFAYIARSGLREYIVLSNRERLGPFAVVSRILVRQEGVAFAGRRSDGNVVLGSKWNNVLKEAVIPGGNVSLGDWLDVSETGAVVGIIKTGSSGEETWKAMINGVVGVECELYGMPRFAGKNMVVYCGMIGRAFCEIRHRSAE